MNNHRLLEEAQFADSEYAPMIGDTRISSRMFAKYERPNQMWDWRQRAARLLGNLRDQDLLDYGCGQGEESAYFAKLGARVTAIDISDVGVRVGRERAGANGLDIDFRVMQCAPTEFPDEYFDLVHGMGILHHVGLADGLAEVHRMLRPGGIAVFLEPLGSSPLVETAKRMLHGRLSRRLNLIPVTSGEENLKLAEIKRECAPWAYHRIHTYRLTYRARKLFVPSVLWDWALRLDHALLATMPPLRHFAGAAVLHLRK
jgi:2-polyprenyl-3-methyl-5-hydroxy-6-metoxy-1,4-benzoquinol methylase